MAIMSWLAEQRIEEAMRKGEFRNLPGHGKPLELEDLSGVPEELRMSFKIMKNAGLLPEELQLRAECATLENLLAACHDSGAERRTLSRRLTEKKLRLEELLRQRGLDGSAAFAQYGEQIRMRLDKE
ncbi:DnaJ family domain-containing protein [Paenibacillus zanthoxyli]|uniref:DnaJ family domain-containing protein n=1 Tax=Paenibacillus zanthoxyli TaxID=369399 RepID=UPI000470A547|nr:DnaJ family domain-containing protein [Paenibacillus zanthoxyli]